MEIPHRVPAHLRTLVSSMTGYDFRLDPTAVHHGVPGPSATVIISFDEPLDVAWLDRSEGRGRHWLLASGLHTRPALIRTHGVQHGIQLALTPLGCRVLLGVPIGALHQVLCDHEDLPMGIPEALHARMAEATWAERFRLLDEHLSLLASRTRASVANDLERAWHVLTRRRGRVRVDELAAEVGWSRRHLVNRFTAEYGLPPRDVARLHRFGAAQDLARRGMPWAEVANRAGYADQPHLSREFRHFTGQTPTAWRDEVFPNLQDTEHSAQSR